jgi:ferritin-like metal-binding protein YciE
MRYDRMQNLIESSVQHLYDAENQLVLALPRISARAQSPKMREALRSHLEETRIHASRLESIASIVGVPFAGRRCRAMQGLLEEGEEMFGPDGTPELVDLALESACQAVEHYEIASYECLKNLLMRAEFQAAAAIAQSTLSEELTMSQTLSHLSPRGESGSRLPRA